LKVQGASSTIAPKLAVLEALLSDHKKKLPHEFDITVVDFASKLEALIPIYSAGVHVGNNALARLSQIYEKPFNVNDDVIVGTFMSTWYLKPSVTPREALKDLMKEARALPLPNKLVNWEKKGLPRDAAGRFICVSDDNLVNQLVQKLEERFSHHDFTGTSIVFSEEIYNAARRGDLTVEWFDRLCQQLDDKHIHHTNPLEQPSSGAHAEKSHQAFSAAADASTTTRPGGRQLGRGEGKGDGKGKGEGKGKGKGEKKPRENSVGPKEKDAVYFYGRAAALIGTKFERMPALVELINTYFLTTTGSNAFRREGGKITIPVIPDTGFSWIAREDDLNFNSRRDVYAAFQLFRDLMMPPKKGQEKVLSKVGAEYARTKTNWTAKTRVEFIAMYAPSASTAPLALQQATIRGQTVKEFTA
jgi:hypothetical protein